jgi:hypothetical protein
MEAVQELTQEEQLDLLRHRVRVLENALIKEQGQSETLYEALADIKRQASAVVERIDSIERLFGIGPYDH